MEKFSGLTIKQLFVKRSFHDILNVSTLTLSILINSFDYYILSFSSTDTKLTSFQRQLNLYGFRRLTKGDHHGACFHPKFQRDRDDLLLEVVNVYDTSVILSLHY